MDPISIAAMVCAVVSAFTGAASLFKRRKKFKPREPLERSLALGPTQVQSEYDRNFTRLGARFAKGDEIGHIQLSSIIIDLQSKLILTLQALLSGGSEDYSSLLSISDKSRIGAISALASQFQRLSVAAPIQSPSNNIPGDRALWNDTDQGMLYDSCVAWSEHGKSYTFEKGRNCTVLNEGTSTTAWVKFTFADPTWDSNVKYSVPKKYLIRRYVGPHNGVLNAECVVTRVDDTSNWTFGKGRACTVYNDVNAEDVYVRFTFSDPLWDNNAAYKVQRKYIDKV